MKIPLKVIESPYREITRPVVDHVKSVHRASPRDVVCVWRGIAIPTTATRRP